MINIKGLTFGHYMRYLAHTSSGLQARHMPAFKPDARTFFN